MKPKLDVVIQSNTVKFLPFSQSLLHEAIKRGAGSQTSTTRQKFVLFAKYMPSILRSV